MPITNWLWVLFGVEENDSNKLASELSTMLKHDCNHTSQIFYQASTYSLKVYILVGYCRNVVMDTQINYAHSPSP